MARRVDVGVGQPGVLSQGQHDAVVAVGHPPGGEVALPGPGPGVAGCGAVAGLLLPEGLDPRRGQPAVGQAAEDAVRGARHRCCEPARLARGAHPKPRGGPPTGSAAQGDEVGSAGHVQGAVALTCRSARGRWVGDRIRRQQEAVPRCDVGLSLSGGRLLIGRAARQEHEGLTLSLPLPRQPANSMRCRLPRFYSRRTKPKNKKSGLRKQESGGFQLECRPRAEKGRPGGPALYPQHMIASWLLAPSASTAHPPRPPSLPQHQWAHGEPSPRSAALRCSSTASHSRPPLVSGQISSGALGAGLELLSTAPPSFMRPRPPSPCLRPIYA